MNILITDDHAIVRLAVKQLLAARFPEAEFGEAKTAQETLELVWKQEWTVLVLDVSMPGRSGLDVLADILQARPKLPVLVYSAHPEEQFAIRVLKAGAAGYLTKESDPQELVQAVEHVLTGRKFVTAALAQRLATVLGKDSDKPPHELLSNREFEVLRQLATGRSVKEIAGDSALSVKTISTYRTRVLQKLDLQTNADLVRYAMKYSLVD
jgi:two-component system, NarL family, invasion response regulator UvrY